MAKVDKDRKFYIMSYLSKEQIEQVISEKQNQIKAIAYAFHDKDDNEPHFHILLYCYSKHTISGIAKWFNRSAFVDDKGMNINTFVEFSLSVKGSFNYLTHEDDEDKFHYDQSIICGYNIDFFRDNTEVDFDPLSESINDLLCGVSLYECVQRYGRDFIIHYGHIKALLNDINNS